MGLLETKNGRGNVVFNFRRNPVGDISAFATGYHNAGKALVSRFNEARGYRDNDCYPIFFLYRHAVELRLKAIAYVGANLLQLISDTEIGKNPHLFSSHKLTNYIPLLKKVCANRNWKLNERAEGLPSLDEAFALVRELEAIDSHSYTFRYPVDTNGDPALDHHTVLNVIHFAHELDGLLELLGCFESALDYDWDNAAEVLYEVQEILKRSD